MAQQTIQVRAANIIATGFYSGYSPIIPGTAGTAVAALLTFALHRAVPSESHVILQLSLLLFFTFVGWYSTHLCLKAGIYGAGAKDPGAVVTDEFAGFYLAVLGWGAEPMILLLGFIIFRLFDIAKPPPVDRLERLPGALGVMADDLGAGVLTAIALAALMQIWMYLF